MRLDFDLSKKMLSKQEFLQDGTGWMGNGIFLDLAKGHWYCFKNKT